MMSEIVSRIQVLTTPYFFSSHPNSLQAVHDESLPWIVTFVLTAVTAYAVQHPLPFHISMCVELVFFLHCTIKLLTKFDVPETPEPLLNDRDWEQVVKSIWSSQTDVPSRRSFLMGWFYDAPFERLRREDAITYLAWMRFGIPLEGGYLRPGQLESLVEFDLRELERNINYGRMLPLRREGEEPLSCIRFNLEPLRYRHKPLIFYFVTHGAFFLLRRGMFGPFLLNAILLALIALLDH